MVLFIAILAFDGFEDKVAFMFVIDGKEMLFLDVTFADGFHKGDLRKRHNQ
jgi:hypothetical protein